MLINTASPFCLYINIYIKVFYLFYLKKFVCIIIFHIFLKLKNEHFIENAILIYNRDCLMLANPII